VFDSYVYCSHILLCIKESDVCNETFDENGTIDTLPTKPSSPLSDNSSPRASVNTSLPIRRSSQGDEKILTKINTKRQPKVKLTFVNGQFVDLQTIEGQEIVEAAYSLSFGVEVDEGESGRRAAIQGILTSHPSGHCGILGASSSHLSLSSSFIGGYRSSSPSPKLAAQAMSKMSSLTSFSRAKSEASASSIETTDSFSSSQISAFDSDPDDGKNAVTSIVALGNGYFLTSSKCDRVSSIVYCLL